MTAACHVETLIAWIPTAGAISSTDVAAVLGLPCEGTTKVGADARCMPRPERFRGGAASCPNQHPASPPHAAFAAHWDLRPHPDGARPQLPPLPRRSFSTRSRPSAQLGPSPRTRSRSRCTRWSFWFSCSSTAARYVWRSPRLEPSKALHGPFPSSGSSVNEAPLRLSPGHPRKEHRGLA